MRLPEVDARIARELGRALGAIGGRRDDPWIGRIARVVRDFLPPSAARAKGCPGGEEPGEDAVLELKGGL